MTKQCLYAECSRPVRFRRPQTNELPEGYFCREHTPRWRRGIDNRFGEVQFEDLESLLQYELQYEPQGAA